MKVLCACGHLMSIDVPNDNLDKRLYYYRTRVLCTKCQKQKYIDMCNKFVNIWGVSSEELPIITHDKPLSTERSEYITMIRNSIYNMSPKPHNYDYDRRMSKKMSSDIRYIRDERKFIQFEENFLDFFSETNVDFWLKNLTFLNSDYYYNERMRMLFSLLGSMPVKFEYFNRNVNYKE